MKCPACAGELVEIAEAGVAIDTCRACRGLWFDGGELGAVLGVGEPKAAEDVTPGGPPRLCPRCAQALVSYRYVGTRVRADRCEKCRGAWLDRGELGTLREAVEAAKRRKRGGGPPKSLGERLLEFLGRPR